MSKRQHNKAKIKKILAKIDKIHHELPRIKEQRAMKRYISLSKKLQRIEDGDL